MAGFYDKKITNYIPWLNSYNLKTIVRQHSRELGHLAGLFLGIKEAFGKMKR